MQHSFHNLFGAVDSAPRGDRVRVERVSRDIEELDVYYRDSVCLLSLEVWREPHIVAGEEEKGRLVVGFLA